MAEKEKYPKTIVDAPGDMEMSRTEECPVDENESQKLSLAQKLKDHYNTGMTKKKRKIDNSLTPVFLNRSGVPIFLFTFVATVKIGVLDVMPQIYEGNDWTVFCHQSVVVLIATQMLINWLGIRYVSSSYPSYKRRLGMEELMKKDENLFYQQISKHKPDSSSAVLMPLITETNKSNGSEQKETIIGEKTQEILRNPGNDLTQEVAKANKEMQRRLDEEKNGIQDLISKDDDFPPSPSKADKSTDIPRSDKSSENEVKVPTPVMSSNTKTVTYPYWSWTPCYQCISTRPPRCHHCPLCQSCILKRDHHCFFAGNCVGYRNQRFFYIFLIWALMGSFWATLHGFPYIYIFLWEDMSYVDVLCPLAIIRFLFGYVSFQVALSVTTLSLLIYFDIITTVFIYSNTILIGCGATSFEKLYLKKNLVIQDTRTLGGKMQAIFGKNWLAMFFLPIHFFIEPTEDPVNWPHIKVIRN